MIPVQKLSLFTILASISWIHALLAGLSEKNGRIVVLSALLIPNTFFFCVTVAEACEIRLKQPVPTCPTVAYDPGDCDSVNLSGKKGESVHATALHVMTNGSVYACGSHESCVELKYLTFKNCKFEFVDRKPGESPEYASHFVMR